MLLIQQKDILNSADVPLAFLFRKVIIGPDCGNIGGLLKSTGNPTFHHGRKEDIIWALEEGRRLSVRGKGEMNYAYAMENMCVSKVGKQYAALYKELANRA